MSKAFLYITLLIKLSLCLVHHFLYAKTIQHMHFSVRRLIITFSHNNVHIYPDDAIAVYDFEKLIFSYASCVHAHRGSIGVSSET